jgi:asparagine synthase (glutamine-hydrolysing)
MCGINGIVSSVIPAEKRSSLVKEMNRCLSHRGPDAEDQWNDGMCSLGHRRLSIIDLSDAGKQPMHSYDGRYVIVYNGELYNYKEIKFELSRAPLNSGMQPYPFKTNTDTEVLLAAWMRWGKDCLSKLNGMFAFAIWDVQQQELTVVRDRLGIKPLYYYKSESEFIFSSELRALLSTGVFPKQVDADALSDYLRYQTVHAPSTIISGVKMLLPGHFLQLKTSVMQIEKWWALKDHVKLNPEENPLTVQKEIKGLFFSSVERRLVSDVPFGAFLSGGIDSSAVVGAMASVSEAKIETFNVSFDESEFNESVYARAISKKFNTAHHEIKLSPNDFLKELPQALSAMDHPSGDGPNTFVVSKATKQAGITMALSGLGGDELFCGYDIFKRSYSLEKKWWLNLTPRFARKIAAEAIRLKKKSVSGEKMAEVLSKPVINFEYSYPVSRQVLDDALVKGITGKSDLPFNSVYRIVRLQALGEKKLHLSKYSVAEMETYMQNVLLRDTDQMSMAVALEVRVPFLDYTLVEYVLGINDALKYPHTPKKLLTDSLGDLLPREIIDRPKMGFTFPWAHWMKNELKDFCEARLLSFGQREYINGNVIASLWKRFLAGDNKITWSRIWHLVVLENWLQSNKIE